jgi:hypothetical protein
MNVRVCLIKNKYTEKSHGKFKNDLTVYLKELSIQFPGIKYELTCHKCAHIYVALVNKDDINTVFPSDELKGFSVTDLRANVIFICYENWNNMKLNNSSKLYRKYVIIHEFLHAFPFYVGHCENSCENGSYNVMFQQTRIAGTSDKQQMKKCLKSDIFLPNSKKNHMELDNKTPDDEEIRKRYKNFDHIEGMKKKQAILKKLQKRAIQ